MPQGTVRKFQASTGVVKPGEQYVIMPFSYAKLFLFFNVETGSTGRH